MYVGGITFSITKSFGSIQLIPEPTGLRIVYTPTPPQDSTQSEETLPVDLIVPLDMLGGLWATTKAFILGVESLDENVHLNADATHAGDPHETLIKLYRDKPKGIGGKLSGEEICWLRIVTGRSEEERRRIKLGARDLVCLELACSAVFVLSAIRGTHDPRLGNLSENTSCTLKVVEKVAV